MSAAGFSGGVAGGLANLNGNFNLDYVNDTEYDSEELSNGRPVWMLEYDGTTWTLIGTDNFANVVNYTLDGTWDPHGSNTFDSVSSSGGGTCPSTLTITIA
jgi:hypothetical protein